MRMAKLRIKDGRRQAGKSRTIVSRLALVVVGLSLTDPAWAASDWPSYNNQLSSSRYSKEVAINARNVKTVKPACTFDTGEMTAFQSGLVMVNGKLIFTTEHDTIAINPDSCALIWRAHEDFANSFLGAQRGVAVENGRVFRGARNGHVYAYDLKTGKKLWETAIADVSKGESAPAAPIAWNGLVFMGTAGGDNRGVKGRMYALDSKTGKIVWEFYMVPRSPSDPSRGPAAKGGAPFQTWGNSEKAEITGGGTWTSYTLDPATGELYVPGGNPAPDFDKSVRPGSNLYSGSVVVLDARTGAYKRHFSLVPEDYHDYDVASAPALFDGKDGRKLIAVTPKNGMMYILDRNSGERLHELPVNTQANNRAPLTGLGVRFCPGSQGGSEWNGPAFDARNGQVLSGQVNWCTTVSLADSDDTVASVQRAQAWTGDKSGGFGEMDGKERWGGWLTAVDPASGAIRWSFRSGSPIIGAVTPTAGGLVMFGNADGTLFALDSSNGHELASWDLGGAIGGGVITYDTGAGQAFAVAAGMTSPIWPTAKITAKVVVLKVSR